MIMKKKGEKKEEETSRMKIGNSSCLIGPPTRSNRDFHADLTTRIIDQEVRDFT